MFPCSKMHRPIGRASLYCGVFRLLRVVVNCKAPFRLHFLITSVNCYGEPPLLKPVPSVESDSDLGQCVAPTFPVGDRGHSGWEKAPKKCTKSFLFLPMGVERAGKSDVNEAFKGDPCEMKRLHWSCHQCDAFDVLLPNCNQTKRASKANCSLSFIYLLLSTLHAMEEPPLSFKIQFCGATSNGN